MKGKRLLAAIVLIFAATVGVLYSAGGNGNPYCDEEHRYFSDDDFLRAALESELARWQLPEGFSIGSVDAFLGDNPDCCRVERGSHRFACTNYFDCLLLGESVLVSVVVPSGGAEYDHSIDYVMSGCGQVRDRFTGRIPPLGG